MTKRVYWSNSKQIGLQARVTPGVKQCDQFLSARFLALLSSVDSFSGRLWEHCNPKIGDLGPRSVCEDIEQKRAPLHPEHFHHGPGTSLTYAIDLDVGPVPFSEPFSSWNQRRGYADWHQLIRTHSRSEVVVGRGQSHPNSLGRKFGI